MPGAGLRRILQTKGGRHEKANIDSFDWREPLRCFRFRLRLSLRQSRSLRFAGAKRTGFATRSSQSDAFARSLGAQSLPRRLAIAPGSRADFSPSEPRQLAVPSWLRHVAFASRDR